MKQTRLSLWVFISLTVGAMTWFVVQFIGHGLVKKEALSFAVLISCFVFGLWWVNLSTPDDEDSRKRAILTRSSKRNTLIILGLLTGFSLFNATQQGLAGYPDLDERLVNTGAELELGFYSASGKPMLNASYTMRGSEGEHNLVPLDSYEGRVIAMIDHLPSKDKAIRVTGRLRTDVRTVQRSKEGVIEGPLLRLYREHVGLPENTTVYFLDTGKRAGLNVRMIALVLVPLYLFLLTFGSPIRRERPMMRPRAR